jgi:hypothetical protein
MACAPRVACLHRSTHRIGRTAGRVRRERRRFVASMHILVRSRRRTYSSHDPASRLRRIGSRKARLWTVGRGSNFQSFSRRVRTFPTDSHERVLRSW